MIGYGPEAQSGLPPGDAMEDFKRAATEGKRTGMLSEFVYFLKTSKKWWLLPIIVILVGFGALVFLSSTAAAPFIYTLF